MLAIQQYSDSSDDERCDEPGDSKPIDESSQDHLKPLSTESEKFSVKKQLQVCSAPVVLPTGVDEGIIHIHPDTNEVNYNPKYEELFAPMVGPENPFKTQQQSMNKNTLAGHVEPAHVSSFQFENQRRTFASFGYALDPSVSGEGSSLKVIGANEANNDSAEIKTVFENTKLRPLGMFCFNL